MNARSYYVRLLLDFGGLFNNRISPCNMFMKGIMIGQYKSYIHIVPSSSTATRSSNSSHSIEKRLSTTNALLFLFHLTLRFDLLGPGFNKSITYKDTKVKTYQL